MGIALCHFELAAIECGLSAAFSISDPGIPAETDTLYTAASTMD